MSVREYAERMFPYAARAAAETGLYPSVILAQWGNESGWGTSYFASFNNHAGITYVEESIAAGPIPQPGIHGQTFARYATLGQFVSDYVRVMKLSYYRQVLQLCAEGAPADEVCYALGTSPYDAGGYMLNDIPGGKLMVILENYPELREFDQRPRPNPGVAGGGGGGYLILSVAILLGLGFLSRLK